MLYAIVGVAVGTVFFVRNLDTAASFYQAFDNVHHLNSIRSFVDSGNYSSFNSAVYLESAGSLASPYLWSSSSFYPSAWHGLVSMVVQALDIPITVGINAVNVMLLCVVFPLGVYELLKALTRDKRLLFLGAFLSVGVIVGLTNNLYSLYVIPITTGLGISRGLYSMGITVRYIASAFCNLFMGRLYQRFGYRRPTVLLVLLVAASYVGYGTARNAVPLFLGALIYGVGEYFISTAALSRMLGNWFQSHLGVVTGIVMAASGVGGSALSLVLSGIMESAGWRTSLLFAAGLLAAVAVMIFFVMKDRPEELGLQPYHDPERRGAAHKPKKVAAPWAGVPMQVLLKKPYFYLTMIGMMLATIASNGVYSAVVPHLQDRGLSAAYAAKMLSLMLVLLAVDKIVLGMLADRFGAHFSTLLCVLFTFSGIVVLTLVKNEWQAVIAVVLLSVSVCLNGFIQPLLAAEIFGRSAYNTTLGIMMAMLSVGGLLSSPLVNFSFDATGSYTRILIVLAVIAAVDALFLLPAFHAEAKYRRELEASGQLSDAGPET